MTNSETPTVFDACTPRQDVIAGDIPEDQFAASIDSVAHSTNAPDVYANPKRFFEKTYPTNGIQDLLTRLTTRFVHDHKSDSGYSGTNGIIRLDTSFGGGKTHTEIAAYHLATQPDKINNLHEYLEAPEAEGDTSNEELADEYLEQTALGLNVNTSVIVGAEIDANNARCDMVDDDAPATKTLWGEMAYQLFGHEGYEVLKEYDERRIAPGAKKLTELFEMFDDPSLIMLDEIAAYMAQASGFVEDIEDDGSLDIADNAVVGESTLAEQTNAFLMALLSATENNDHVTVVLSIADTAFEKQADEVRRMLTEITDEFNNIADRTEQSITPTEDTEIASVLRHRLFETIDGDLRDRVVEAYLNHYNANRSEFPELENESDDESLEERLKNSYPFHPTTIDTLTKELDSLPKFHRTRGALKLLSRGISDVWRNGSDDQPYDRHFIRVSDLHPKNTYVHSTLLRLYDSTGLDFEAPIKADIYSADGTAHATVANNMYSTPAPMGTHLTTTILWKSLVETASGRGVSKPKLLYAVSHADMDISEYRNVLNKLIDATNNAACYYLHREGNGTARYVFKVQPKPIKIVESVDVDEGIVRTTMVESLKDVVGKTGAFNVIMQPEGPHAVPDEATTHHLCVMDFDTVSIINTDESATPPDLVDEIYTYWASTEGGQKQMRQYKNNIVFLVPEAAKISDAREMAEKHASIKHVQRNYNDDYDLSGEAEDKLNNMLDGVKGDLHSSLKNAYSNAYYAGTGGLQYLSFQSSGKLSDDITTELADQGELVKSGDDSYGVQWIENRIWNSNTDVMTTEALEEQFGKQPGADILLSAVPLRKTVADIVSNNGYAYWDETTDTGYYTEGADVESEDTTVTDAKNLTTGLDTSDVVISDTHSVFSSVSSLIDSEKTEIDWEEPEDEGESSGSDDEKTETGGETNTGEGTSTTGSGIEEETDVTQSKSARITSPAHIETAINELRSKIATKRDTFKQTNDLTDSEFETFAEKVVIGIESVDGWQEAWFVANKLDGTGLFNDTTIEFEYIAETDQQADGELTFEYGGDISAFANHCKFNMEPSEITGSDGEKVAEADFIISDVTRSDGTTPTYDVLLDELKDLLAVDNGFTIRLNTDLLFTTETGGDQ
jgi:hypothetical protein